MSTKYGTRYRVRVNFAINLRSHLYAGVILICYTVLTSPKNGETAVHGCNPTFIGFCRVGVSQSLAVLLVDFLGFEICDSRIFGGRKIWPVFFVLKEFLGVFKTI